MKPLKPKFSENKSLHQQLQAEASFPEFIIMSIFAVN